MPLRPGVAAWGPGAEVVLCKLTSLSQHCSTPSSADVNAGHVCNEYFVKHRVKLVAAATNSYDRLETYISAKSQSLIRRRSRGKRSLGMSDAIADTVCDSKMSCDDVLNANDN